MTSRLLWTLGVGVGEDTRLFPSRLSGLAEFVVVFEETASGLSIRIQVFVCLFI